MATLLGRTLLAPATVESIQLIGLMDRLADTQQPLHIFCWQLQQSIDRVLHGDGGYREVHPAKYSQR